MRRLTWIILLASLLPPVLFGQEKQKKLDPCALLTAADAASIAGAPMPLVDRSKDNCTYGVLGKRIPGGGRALDRSVEFSVKTYKSAQALDKEWGKARDAHNSVHKNDTQGPGGIGDEAFLPDRTKEGKVTGITSIISVRKGLVVFGLLIFDKDIAASADEAIAVAKRIADQL
jgi:hypothetical protein